MRRLLSIPNSVAAVRFASKYQSVFVKGKIADRSKVIEVRILGA